MRYYPALAIRTGVVLLAVLALLMGVSVTKLSLYRIQTGSMAPDFPIGTIVVDSGIAPLAVHRAITFTADGKTLTHVLVGYRGNGSLITRGIANAANDVWQSPIYPHDVHGRVLFGILLFAPAFWTGWQGRLFIIGLALAVLTALLWRRAGRLP